VGKLLVREREGERESRRQKAGSRKQQNLRRQEGGNGTPNNVIPAKAGTHAEVQKSVP
jgi:hypothetical protein